MIHIDFDPNQLTGALKIEWEKLMKRANTATEKIIKKWEETGDVKSDDFDNEIWRDLKKFLLDHVFHGKCAYCERNMDISGQPGTADHFRPKAGVKNKKEPKPEFKPVISAITVDELLQPPVEKEHPGYFWLAYNWRNLLPACDACNSMGKMNQFPIKEGKHTLCCRLQPAALGQLKGTAIKSLKDPSVVYLSPQDLDEREHPLLLNPYFTPHPSDFIEFDQVGNVHPKMIGNIESEEGKYTIDVYNLGSAGLCQARQLYITLVENRFDAAMSYFRMLKHMSPGDAMKKALEEEDFQKILKGLEPFSAAQMDHLNYLARL